MDTLKGRKRWPDEKLIARALSAKTDKASWNNIVTLRSRASAGLYEKCIELTKSELPAEREVGVDILAEFYRRNKRKKYGYDSLYSKKRLKHFLKMIAVEKNTDVLESLLWGIGKNNSYIKSKDIDLILPFIDSLNKDIRFATTSALRGIDNMKAIKGLITLSRDRYACIRDWSTFAIGTISEIDNDEIRKALYARCTDRHYDTRMEAISGLAKRKDDGVKKYLEKEFSDCTVYVLQSIRDLDAKEYLPRLEAELGEAEKNPDAVNSYWFGELKECVEKLRGGPQDT